MMTGAEVFCWECPEETAARSENRRQISDSRNLYRDMADRVMEELLATGAADYKVNSDRNNRKQVGGISHLV